MVPPNSLKRTLASSARKYHQALVQDPEGPAYLWLTEDRGLTPETIEEYMLGVVDPDCADPEHQAMIGYISMPYLTPTSRVDRALNFADIRFRRGPGVSDDRPKVRSIPGHRSRLYCTTTLAAPGPYVAIAEGEMDTLTLNQCDIPAVGVAGVSAWNADYYDKIFSGFEKVILPADNDDDGQGKEFAERVAKSVPNPKIVLMPEGEDVNSYFMKVGAAELRAHLGVD